MEDAYLDPFMEDFISNGYATPPLLGNDWYDAADQWEEDDEERFWEEFSRGFDEAHARSEEDYWDRE